MEIVYSDTNLARYIETATIASPDRPILVDQFLEDALEVDVDAIYDGEEILFGGILEHIEEAGVHSGDSACVMPPHTLSDELVRTLVDYTKRIASALGVRGLIHVQYAVREGTAFVLEANPRASRTVPFCSKVLGVPLAKVATWVMLGRSLRWLRDDGLLPETPHIQDIPYTAVKEAVLPWGRFPGVDTILGPEMRFDRRGDGDRRRLRKRLRQSAGRGGYEASCERIDLHSLRDADKEGIVEAAKQLKTLGFDSTRPTERRRT